MVLRLGPGAGAAAVVSANGRGPTLNFPPLQLGDVTAHLRPALWLHLRAGPLGSSSPGVAGRGLGEKLQNKSSVQTMLSRTFRVTK